MYHMGVLSFIYVVTCVHKLCCLKACEKWRVDVECCTAMVSRLSEERQQAMQQADEVGR